MRRLKTALLVTSGLILFGPAPALAAETESGTADLAAQVQTLSQQVKALQAQIEILQDAQKQSASELQSTQKALSSVQPNWKGAPAWEDRESGFTFKPKGTVQFDAGYVSIPSTQGLSGLNANVGGVNTNNLGWNMRARRLLIGAEGDLPGGFGYKVEFNFAQSKVDYEDLILTYTSPKNDLTLTVGSHYPLSSLDQMTSSRFISFMERSGATDAFGYNRRLGLSFSYAPKGTPLLLAAGIWGDTITEDTFNRTSWQASTRAVYAPKWGKTQIHLGAQFQHRVQKQDDQSVRYRQRPYTQITDQRFIDTKSIAANGDDIAGIEFGLIHGPLHVASEWQHLWVRGYQNPLRVYSANNGSTGVYLAGNPQFDSAYFELGYFLTGESRGYKPGRWDRTKVRNPFNKGGWGALQINGRLDYTNLNDRVAGGADILSGNGATYVNGGKSLTYQSSLMWLPTDYVRFIFEYSHINIEGGPSAIAPFADTSSVIYSRNYDLDMLALRAQLDF